MKVKDIICDSSTGKIQGCNTYFKLNWQRNMSLFLSLGQEKDDYFFQNNKNVPMKLAINHKVNVLGLLSKTILRI